MKTTIDIAEATRLTRLGRLDEAMAVLRGESTPQDTASPEGFIDMVQTGAASWSAAFEATTAQPAAASRPKVGLAERVRDYMAANRPVGAATQSLPAGATFTEHSYACASGSRSYKLYIPGTVVRAPVLIVMLHGCTQSPDDFAAGTQMNALAEEQGFLVVYPAQSQSANMNRCWNWFNSADQQCDTGEPALIAGITRQVMAEHGVDPSRVFVAGLSAGGAMAAILGNTYPDLYAAIGVHSGLPAGAAHDMPSAFSAMGQGAKPGKGKSRASVPTIVFHGDADTTVNVGNGRQVIQQAQPSGKLVTETVSAKSAGGIGYIRTVQSNQDGVPVLEHWLLHGAGHAWAGGHTAGSYTDPRGPDASREMLRFFLAQRRK